ncbi:unnamed protein product, partial [Callosobruchus maculatus]
TRLTKHQKSINTNYKLPNVNVILSYINLILISKVRVLKFWPRIFFNKQEFPAQKRMITDVHLAIMSNALGIVLFLLVVLYHYINANYSRS